MFVSFRKCSPPKKPDPISDRNSQNLYPISDQNGSKTIPFGSAHTYIPYIGEYPPPPGNRVCKLVCQSEAQSRIYKPLALKIEQGTDKENVYLIFNILLGSRKLQDANTLIDTDLSCSLDKLDNQDWKKPKHWSR